VTHRHISACLAKATRNSLDGQASQVVYEITGYWGAPCGPALRHLDWIGPGGERIVQLGDLMVCTSYELMGRGHGAKTQGVEAHLDTVADLQIAFPRGR
jgi:hypothetical protein